MKHHDVMIIGAGPYGLSAAAHLRHAGVEPYVIGQPMAFWKKQMPAGMLLRSGLEASNISSPQEQLSITRFRRQTRRSFSQPIPIDDFIAYGEWFQQQIAPAIDTRAVSNLWRNEKVFHLTMEDGEPLTAKAVVLALGIGRFYHRPTAFSGIPSELAPHSSGIRYPNEFKGLRVAVIGKGQSALETAALLHENGADVQILTRGSAVEFFNFPWKKRLFRLATGGPLKPLSHYVLPPTDLLGFRKGRLVAHPELFRRQPSNVQQDLIKYVTWPIGAYWLRGRLAAVPARTSVSVVSVSRAGDRLHLRLSNGESDEFDRVVLATGYRIDISKYELIERATLARISRTDDGYPILSTGLETSVPGLFMMGAVGERTLGPTLRFVTGTSNAAPRLAAAVAGTSWN